MTNEKLKPCPFCGDKAAICKSGAVMFVRCLNCGAESVAIDRDIDDLLDFEAERECIKVWNRRVEQ